MSIKELTTVLQELASASRSIANESDFLKVIKKYDMLFLGENFNHIYSLELRHTLEKEFDIKTSNEELNSLIPTACESLGMKFTPMFPIKSLSRSDQEPYCYQIILW